MAKGTFFLLIAQLIFLGSGYVIHFGVARMVSQDEYGRFGVVMSIASYLTIFATMGVPSSVIKFVSEGRNIKVLIKKAIKLQLLISSVPIGIIILSSSNLTDFLNDNEMGNLILLLPAIVFIMAFYYLFLGVLVGQRDFKTVAILKSGNPFLRMVLIFSFLYLGYGIFGALMGYILTYVMWIIIAIHLVNRAIISNNCDNGDEISYKELISFSTPLFIYSLFFVLIFNFDLWTVKSLTSDAGYYTCAKQFANIGFIIIAGLNITLFPSISKANSLEDKTQLKDYIRETFRYAFILIIPIIVIVYNTAEELITVMYPDNYVKSAETLSVLIIGISLIVIFSLNTQIFKGIGQPVIPLAISIIMCIVLVPSTYYFIERYGMIGGAISITIVGILGTGISIILINKIVGCYVDLFSIIKILFSSGILFILTYAFTFSGIYLIAWHMALVGIYFCCLWILKEINTTDIELIRGVMNIK